VQAAANEAYLCADVSEALESALQEHRPDSILLDPSADGIDDKAAQTILQHGPQQVIYVSCNPPVLARDLAKLATRFRIESVQPFDMFPQTAEIEAVAILSRK
jgi:tRNA/tmRNA/rRNA uracil-C5-methylase (TrmA/RlmC/RlmD family)